MKSCLAGLGLRILGILLKMSKNLPNPPPPGTPELGTTVKGVGVGRRRLQTDRERVDQLQRSWGAEGGREAGLRGASGAIPDVQKSTETF